MLTTILTASLQCTWISSAKIPRDPAPLPKELSTSFVGPHQGHSSHNFQEACSKCSSQWLTQKAEGFQGVLLHSGTPGPASSPPGPWRERLDRRQGFNKPQPRCTLGESSRAWLSRKGQQGVEGFLSRTWGHQERKETKIPIYNACPIPWEPTVLKIRKPLFLR